MKLKKGGSPWELKCARSMGGGWGGDARGWSRGEILVVVKNCNSELLSY